MKHLYSILLQELTGKRWDARYEFLFILRYLFLNWITFKIVPVRNNDVWIKWEAPLGKNWFLDVREDDLKLCLVYTESNYDDDEVNMRKFRAVFCSAKEVT